MGTYPTAHLRQLVRQHQQVTTEDVAHDNGFFDCIFLQQNLIIIAGARLLFHLLLRLLMSNKITTSTKTTTIAVSLAVSFAAKRRELGRFFLSAI